MAPVEDFQSRDLAWISDFVMQQMVIMLRPMMDHLQETDAACDYSQRMVQRLNMDVTEIRVDLERTNKYLAILRQGLGVQNEGKCVLQRSIEGTARTVKRLDDQVENMLSVMRAVEDNVGRMSQDLSKQVLASTSSMEDLQVLQREMREMRRGHLGVVPKLETSWPEKKKLTAYVEPLPNSRNGEAPSFGDNASNHSGSSHQSKRVSRVNSGSAATLRLQQVCGGIDNGSAPNQELDETVAISVSLGTAVAGGDEATTTSCGGSRLPLLGPPGRQPGAAARSSDRCTGGADAGPRLRFSATMAKPESRGNPSA